MPLRGALTCVSSARAQLISWDRNPNENAVEFGNENRIAPEARLTKKPSKWNPGLSIDTRTNRRVEGPKKRWKDAINQVVQPDETEETRGNVRTAPCLPSLLRVPCFLPGA